MRPSNINDIMNLARRARKNGDIFNPLFVGAPGLGKTEIIQEWCEQNSLPFVVITAATYEAPDLKGFPRVELINGKQRQTFATPDFWPDSGEGVIILEEVNRGTTSVMNCFMSLTDKRRGFDGYKLPEGWLVAGCINPENEHNDVNVMDTALKDRFEIFEVNYDKKEFLKFMKNQEWNNNIQMFIETGTWTYVKPEDLGNSAGAKYLSPRGFSKLNAALKAEVPKDMQLDIYESILGKNVGQSFFQFTNDDQPVLLKDILETKKKAFDKLKKFSDPDNYKSGHITITIRSIVEQDGIEDDLLAEVACILPADQSQDLIKQLEYKRKDDKILERLCKSHPEVKKYLKSVLVK
jgi:hypothetical protein